MFDGAADRLKKEARRVLLLSAIAGACTATAAIALAFICAAVFIAALERYGLVDACLVGAAIFLAATLVLLAVYTFAASRRRKRRAQSTPEPQLGALADPRVVLLGLQIVKAVGIRRLVPLVALGGLRSRWRRPRVDNARLLDEGKCRLDVPDQRQNQEDDEDKAEAARWIVSPAGTVRPCRERADEKDDDNDEKNETHRTVPQPARSHGPRENSLAAEMFPA